MSHQNGTTGPFSTIGWVILTIVCVLVFGVQQCGSALGIEFWEQNQNQEMTEKELWQQRHGQE